MVYLSSRIRVGNLVFKSINSFQIESSRKSLTDTAVIYAPNVSQLKSHPIKIGDIVEIAFGYDDKNNTEFYGYVSELNLETSPIEIRCEDEMWKLKQEFITKSWESVSLLEALKFICPTVNSIECPDVQLTSFRLVNVTKSKALSELKEAYGIDIYFRDKKLFAGIPYTETGGRTVKYHYQKNIPGRAVQSGLSRRNNSANGLRVEAINILQDNSKKSIFIGDVNGEKRTIHFYNLTDADLKKQAEIEVKKISLNELTGNLLTFGQPYARHGDIAQIHTQQIDASYFIDTVNSSYGPGGIRRKVELGRKAS